MRTIEDLTVPELIERLAAEDTDTVVEAADEIGRRRATEAAPRLLELLRLTPEATIRNATALALSDMEMPEAFDSIAELLRDPSTEGHRGTLLYALDPYDCLPILELLIDLALTGGYEVRMSALGLISGIEGDIDEEIWDRVRARLEAAAATAGKERRTEVIDPLLEMFS
ncbi:HEAT repeat domain-containing protein [Actinoplanes oblitus]|uniref:HEAT repeat domain-containing protein n=1 Tax=Actinoplanes oblitus TaxID=3040509 RepID=A0ABY8WKL5_9ACTN|nr:HEAT repeat domain-containing protein [Actinoplanes oblitus]WIM97400.1 HEAT repeat domain-containing protein [Actinoplanes oblitus]